MNARRSSVPLTLCAQQYTVRWSLMFPSARFFPVVLIRVPPSHAPEKSTQIFVASQSRPPVDKKPARPTICRTRAAWRNTSVYRWSAFVLMRHGWHRT
jgi:hypothetical protein